MTYRQEVKAAAQALVKGDDANWELARLTYENTFEPGDLRAQAEDGYVSMERWCADIRKASNRRFSATTGARFKMLWREYGGLSRRDRPSWSEAYAERIGSGSTRSESSERVLGEHVGITDDEKAEKAANALAVLILRESHGEWKPSAQTHAILYFLGQLLNERQIPKAVTDELVAEVEEYVRSRAGE